MWIHSSMAAFHLRSSYLFPCLSSGDAMCSLAFSGNKMKGLRRKFVNSFNMRNGSMNNRVQASGKYLGPGADQIGENDKSKYHPYEDISDSEGSEGGEGQLTSAETSRTVIEVNSVATLMFSGLVNDEVQENIFWPDLPYLTDEHGNVYFQVNNDEDILQTLTSDNNYVQVIIGLDTKEMLGEMELSGPSSIDFGFEEIEEEDSDFDDEDDDDDDDNEDDDDDDDDDDDYEGDWVNILEVDEDHADSDGSLGDWAKLDTMRSSHPMYFAKKIAEVAADDPIDFMQQPPAGLAIQGLLRPAFNEEQSIMQRHRSSRPDKGGNTNKDDKAVENKLDVGKINGHAQKSTTSTEDNAALTEDWEKENGSGNGTAFYKLEMIKMQLISAYGHQTSVEIEDYRKARPDAIAHSAAKIISRVNAAGEKTTNALKSLCWRCKGLQVEEASLIGIDTLGFDLRVCSGTQVQTLRFAFTSRATSEYSAERQLNELLFPRSNQKTQKVKQARKKES